MRYLRREVPEEGNSRRGIRWDKIREVRRQKRSDQPEGRSDLFLLWKSA